MKFTVICLLLVACGAGTTPPVSGATCEKGSGPVCTSDAGALFCEKGKWVELPCDRLGCRPNQQRLRLNDAGTDYEQVPDGGTYTFCHLPPIDAGGACPVDYLSNAGHCDEATQTANTCSASGVIVAEQCEFGCGGYFQEPGYRNQLCRKHP